MPYPTFYQSPITPLGPREEQSTLDRLTGKVLPGIVWAGQALDKTMGARGLRGLVSGNPRELLSVLPFSDTLGLTDPQQAVHGTGLLRQAGLIHGADDDWENVLAGIGTEIALNPATYLTFGSSALTEAGQAAKALGVLPKTMLGRIQGLSSLTPEASAAAARLGVNAADVLGQPLGGVVGLGLPFQNPIATLGTGKVGEAIAGGLGKAADMAKYSMAGRSLSSLFDSSVDGMTSGPVQRLMRGAHADELASTVPAAREPVAKVLQDLVGAGPYHPEVLRGAMEGQGLGVVAPEYAQAAAQAKAMNAADLAAQDAAWLPANAHQSKYGTDYARRSLAQLDREGAGSQRVLSGRTGSMVGREPYTDVPGGTNTIQGMYRDASVAGPQAALTGNPARAAIMEQHLAGPGAVGRMTQLEWLNNSIPFRAGSPEALELERLHDLWEKSGVWAAKLATAEPERVGAAGVGLGLYNQDPLADLLTGRVQSAKAVANANTAKALLTDPATYAAGQTGGVVPLPQAIAAAGFDPVKGEAGVLASLIQQGVPIPTGGLANMMVPMDVFRDLTRLGGIGQFSDAVGTPLRAIDSLTNVFKRFTLAAPAYFSKKLTSAGFRTLAEGSAPADLAWAAKAAQALRSGQEVEGLAARVPWFAGQTDAEATQELGRLMFAQQAAGRSQAGLPELAMPGASESALAPQIPGLAAEPTMGDIGRSFFKGRTDAAGNSLDTLAERVNPLNLRGVGGVGGLDLRNADQFAPAVATRQFGEVVDDFTRMPTFIERLMQGYAPQAAGDFTKGAHFVGTDLAPFEQSVMRRLVPFYGYLRHKIPWVAENLMEQPGGLQAMAIRGAGDVGELNRENVPPTLGGGLALPVPGAVDGKQAYLTRLGLPFDEAASFLGTGPDAAEHTLMKLAGQLNPLVKAPLEMATGRQFTTDASSTDLYGRTEDNPLQRLLMNSPLGRPASMASTLEQAVAGDKSPVAALTNLLTGAKVSEVDVAKERLAVERDLLERLLSGDANVRKFSAFYVPKDQAQALSPQEVDLLRLQKTLEKRAQDAAKSRR